MTERGARRHRKTGAQGCSQAQRKNWASLRRPSPVRRKVAASKWSLGLDFVTVRIHCYCVAGWAFLWSGSCGFSRADFILFFPLNLSLFPNSEVQKYFVYQPFETCGLLFLVFAFYLRGRVHSPNACHNQAEAKSLKLRPCLRYGWQRPKCSGRCHFVSPRNTARSLEGKGWAAGTGPGTSAWDVGVAGGGLMYHTAMLASEAFSFLKFHRSWHTMQDAYLKCTL